jgi:Rha family phage regulatory protein
MPNLQPKIIVQNGHPTTTSNNIADFFEKEHNKVLRDIETILAICSKEFSLSNFGQSTYKNSRGQTYKNYILTRDGFAMVALAFTGEKAIRFREAYIKRFSEMERQLNEKAVEKIRWQSADNALLPFGTDVIRKHFPVEYIAKWFRHRGIWADATTQKINKLIDAGELEGKLAPRKSIVYADSIIKYLNKQGIYSDTIANELLGGLNQ